MSSIQSVPLVGRHGSLELLCSLPIEGVSNNVPLLFIHGSHCSAHCYMNFLPFLADHGYPSYALSIRGHGASWAQSKLSKMLFTTMYSWAQDVQAALDYLADCHPDAAPPVLGGHSLGGGALQFMLSNGLLRTVSRGQEAKLSGLILLGAAPLTGGGKEILSNWKDVEASAGYPRKWSEPPLLHTPKQVRAAFFSDEAEEETVLEWMSTCKTPEESAMTGLFIFKSLGKASKVLDALTGVGDPGQGRRVLCIAGSEDKLVPPSMVLSNASMYEQAAAQANLGEEACMASIIDGSAHHLMMDAYWENCAQTICSWLQGREVMKS
jgi:pimeloyl-ACP methyl ester carboxylesterase